MRQMTRYFFLFFYILIYLYLGYISQLPKNFLFFLVYVPVGVAGLIGIIYFFDKKNKEAV